jgi:predicted AAA+ superfamily ATPase
MQDLAAWLHRDVDPESAAESIPLLLATLAERTTAPLSRTNVAQTLGYATRPTFDRRIDRLVHAFGALWCHQVDKKGTRVAGAQSKLYLADPLLAWIGPGLRAGAPPPDFTRLTEAALGVALAQAIDAIQPGRWITQDALGYLRTGKGNEIDFGPSPVPTPAGTRHTTPIEGKWVADGWRREALVLEGRLGHGILATKTVLDTSHPTWAVPAPMVALLLG